MISDGDGEPRQHYGEEIRKPREGDTEREVFRSSQRQAILIDEVTEGKK
jgi:hypothetical protein